jgi:hypothetical protein
MVRFFVNGFLVVSDEEFVAGELMKLPAGYRGLGWPWPVDDFDERKLRVERHPCHPEVATNWERALEYWKQCIRQGIPARLLLVKTVQPYPQVAIPRVKWRFLGYDIACPGGGWHSVIWDLWLCWEEDKYPEALQAFQPWKTRLNPNGLFNRVKDAFEFLKFYENLSRDYDTYIERSIDHVIIGLWELEKDVVSLPL